MGAPNDQPLPFGLSETIRDSLCDVFVRFPKIERVLVYGSRATGSYRPHSDIDLVVIAPTMSDLEFSVLWMALDDLPILFRLDVELWHQSTNPARKQAMLDDGIPLYESGQPPSRHATSPRLP